MEYKKIVSLGPSCETAYHVRQLIDQDEAYVFDWVIAPATAVARALDGRLAGIVCRDHLSLQGLGPNDPHPYVQDGLSGIQHHHDFPADRDFMRGFEDVRAKYAFLRERMLGLLDGEDAVLFVHQNGSADEHRQLVEAIRGRYPRLPFALLAILTAGVDEIESDAMVIRAKIPGTGHTWQERTPQWARVLDRVLAGAGGRSIARREPALADAA